MITPEPDESDKLIPLPVIAPASVKLAFPLAVEIMVFEPNVIPVPASPISTAPDALNVPCKVTLLGAVAVKPPV